jgi:TolA-binding protein
MPNTRITRAAAGVVAAAVMSLSSAGARADDVDEAIGKLIRLDLHVHVMGLEFNEAPAEPADLADRRVLDAQAMRGLGRADEAMTLLLTVLVRWPRTLAARDATFELGDALFEQNDLLSARTYYEQAVSKVTGAKREEHALVRLLEIALRTGDFEHVDEYFSLLDARPDAALDPAVVYVKAKVFYYRGKLDEATRLFAQIASTSAAAPTSPYGWRARYFLGTILVKRGDLEGASRLYEGLLTTTAPAGDAREIQDMARLALGRLSYERGQTKRAVGFYQSIAGDSKVLADALYELGWTYVRSQDFVRATVAFERLLRLAPDGPEGPEVKLLVANLHMRQGELGLAQAAFVRARDDVEPAYLKLKAVIERSQADPIFLEILTSRDLDALDLSTFVPASARRWVRGDPEVERLLTLSRDVAVSGKGVAELAGDFERIQGALVDIGREDRLALFPDLGRARRRSTETLVELVELRAEFAGRARRLVQPYLRGAEAQRLESSANEHAVIEGQLGAGQLDAAAMPVKMAAAVSRLQGPWVEEPTMTLAVISGAPERRATERLRVISRQDDEVEQAVLSRLGTSVRAQVDRELEVVSRADASVSQLLELDARLDAEANLRVALLGGVVADRQRDVAAANAKLAVVVAQARDLGGGLARVMYTRVADRLYDLVVRADVGLVDVAWGVKARRAATLQALLVKKNREEGVLADALLRDETALSDRFAKEAAWAHARAIRQSGNAGDAGDKAYPSHH